MFPPQTHFISIIAFCCRKSRSENNNLTAEERILLYMGGQKIRVGVCLSKSIKDIRRSLLINKRGATFKILINLA